MSALSSPAPAPVQAPQRPSPVLAPEPPRKRRGWIVGLVLLLIVAGAVAAYQVWAKSSANNAQTVIAFKTAKAVVAPLEVTLRITGQTSARDFANITTPILRGPEARGSMTLLKLAKSGAIVKKGDLVAQIDAQSIDDHVDDIKDTIASAENDVSKRKAEQAVEWEGMQQTLRVAKSTVEKARLEYQAAEVKTTIEKELLKLAADEADARYRQQQGDVEQRRQAQASELRILAITLDRHKRHLGRHMHDLDHLTIYSPMNGLAVMNMVFRGGDMAQVQPGDQVGPGQPIMKVVDPKSMQVDAVVSQADASDLRLGQPVRIGFDAFSDLKFRGKVIAIGALAQGGFRGSSFVRTVSARVAIEGSDPRLIPDLSAHGDVILETIPNQLQVPLAAVHEENGKASIHVRSGDTWAARAVTVGKRSNTNVAILAGLGAGDDVRLN